VVVGISRGGLEVENIRVCENKFVISITEP
jgi:hypothetical protein